MHKIMKQDQIPKLWTILVMDERPGPDPNVVLPLSIVHCLEHPPNVRRPPTALDGIRNDIQIPVHASVVPETVQVLAVVTHAGPNLSALQAPHKIRQSSVRPHAHSLLLFVHPNFLGP